MRNTLSDIDDTMTFSLAIQVHHIQHCKGLIVSLSMRRVKGKNSPTSYFRCSTLRVARVPHNLDVPHGLATTPGVESDREQDPLRLRVDEVVVEDQLRVLVALVARAHFVPRLGVPLVRARTKVLVAVELTPAVHEPHDENLRLLD